ncbi:hypothetical protein BS78_08G006700 [Paspalum vaginatum]|nr:hypothetical protein BS78_08G006700 [Paspalum vaginatum]
MAFGGLAGSVLGYAAVSPQQQATHPRSRSGAMVVAPRFLLFGSIIFGLLMVFYCMVPPRVGTYVRRRSVARFYSLIVAYLALFLLVAASVVAAVDITRKMNSTIFFVIFCAVIGVLVLVWLVASAYFSWANWANLAVEPSDRPTDDDNKSKKKAALVTDTHAYLSEYVVTGYFTPLFSLVMATHSKSSIEGASGSTESLNWPFRILLSLGLCSILAYAVRGVVFAQRRRGDHEDDVDRHARRWSTWVTYTTMLLTGVAYAVVIGSLKPDELKNIIDW